MSEGYRFGPFSLDCRGQRLLRGNEQIPLTCKAFDVLLTLVENRGRAVEKEELLRQVWPDVVVEESNLSQHIFMLRKLLGDSSENPQYIATVPRRGYRFVAEVVETRDEATPQSPLRGRSIPDIQSLAILPFASLAPDDHEYLGLGLADAVIARLAKLAAIPVRPTSAIRRYVQRHDDPRSVAHDLRVDAVVEGTIQRIAERIRVTVQLVHGHSNTPLWAEQFEMLSLDLFSIEDAISQRIADSLVVTLTGEQRRQLGRRDTENRDAHIAHLKGRYYLNQRRPDSLRRALECFNEAIRHDPSYALAYADLADCYALGAASSVSRRESMTMAKAAALKSLDLDSNLAESHAALAALACRWEWNWPVAEREFRRALELNPSAGSVRHAYALFLTFMGRFDEALSEMTKASELDPLSLVISAGIGRVLDFARRYDEAIAQYERTIDLDARFAEAHFDLAMALRHIGRHEEALAADLEAVALAPDKVTYRGNLAVSYALTGRRDDARRELESLEALAHRTYVSPVVVALVLLVLNDVDGALGRFEEAVDERSAEVPYLAVDPELDTLRSHPRFQSLMTQIGLQAFRPVQTL